MFKEFQNQNSNYNLLLNPFIKNNSYNKSLINADSRSSQFMKIDISKKNLGMTVNN